MIRESFFRLPAIRERSSAIRRLRCFCRETGRAISSASAWKFRAQLAYLRLE